jgi:hypothetical protein
MSETSTEKRRKRHDGTSELNEGRLIRSTLIHKSHFNFIILLLLRSTIIFSQAYDPAGRRRLLRFINNYV